MKRLAILALVILTVVALAVPTTQAANAGAYQKVSCSPAKDSNMTDPCDPCGSAGFSAARTTDPCDPCSSPASSNVARGGDPCDPADPCDTVGARNANNEPVACPVVPTVPDQPLPENPRSDGGLSFNDADLGVVLYQSQDADGNPTLDVYDMKNNGSEGNFMFNITQEDLAPFVGNPPAENTLLKSGGHVSVYILTTGEVQINVGLDSEGKMHVKIFDGIPWSHVYGYTIDPV